MSSCAYADIFKRIEAALDAARVVFGRCRLGTIETEYKIGHDPMTESDRMVDEVLRQNLLREVKAGSPKRVRMMNPGLAKIASGWSIRSTVPVNSSPGFRNSVFPSDSSKMAGPLQAAFTIQRPMRSCSEP